MAYGLLRSPYWSWAWTPRTKHSCRRSWLFHYAEFGEPSAISYFHHRFHCGWVRSSSSNLVRDLFLGYIPHRQVAHPAETASVKRFQFLPVFFFKCPAFTSPECYINNNRLIEPGSRFRIFVFAPSRVNSQPKTSKYARRWTGSLVPSRT
jgi:hypothetical protein